MQWNQLQGLRSTSFLLGQMFELIPSALQHCEQTQVDSVHLYTNCYSHFASCGEQTFVKEVPDSLEWGYCLVNMEMNVEKALFIFFFLDLSWIILAASFLLSKIKPLTKEKGLLETNQNKLFEWQFWKTCLILQCPPPIPPLVFDYAWFLLHLLSQKRLNTKYGSHISLQGKRPW